MAIIAVLFCWPVLDADVEVRTERFSADVVRGAVVSLADSEGALSWFVPGTILRAAPGRVHQQGACGASRRHGGSGSKSAARSRCRMCRRDGGRGLRILPRWGHG